MAQVVDTKGNVKASNTGKKFTGGTPSSKGGGAAALREALGTNELIPSVQVPTPGLQLPERQQARRSMTIPNAIKGRSVKPTGSASFSSPSSMPSVSLPSVSTSSSMAGSMQADESEGERREPSYWDNMRSSLADIVGAREIGDEEEPETSSLMPSVITDGSMQDHVAGEGDVNRWGERYKDNPIANTEIGRTQQAAVGSTRSNDIYESLFSDAGMSDEDLYGMSHRPNARAEFTQNSASPQDLIGVGNIGNKVEDIATVDDGTLDYYHLTSPKMLGSQFQKYARLGMAPGLTADEIEQITPDMVYDKMDLAMNPNVRFQPYLPDDRSLLMSTLEGAGNEISSLAGEMSNLRTNISNLVGNPYTIKYDNGTQSYEINGPEFDKTGYGYIDNIVNDMNSNPNRFFVPHDGEDQSWSQYANRYETINPNGDVEYHYGMPTSNWIDNGDMTWEIEFDDGSTDVVGQEYIDSFPVYDGEAFLPPGIVRASPNYDQTWSQSYSDGTTAVVSSDFLDSVTNNETGRLEVPLEKVDVTGMGFDTNRLNGGVVPQGFTDDSGRKWNAVQASASAWLPNYVMDDGTVLSFDDALAIASDTNGKYENKNLGEGQSIDYNFSDIAPFLSNRPMRLSDTNPWSINDEDGSIERPDLVGNPIERIFDLTAGSLPVMLPMKYSMPIAALDGIQSFYGASQYDPTRNAYKYIPENMSGATADVMTPINEQMVGPIGEGVITPLSWIIDALPSSWAERGSGYPMSILKGAAGAFEEGIEEVLGNFFDEYGSQGLSRMFGPYLDENGNVVDREYQAAHDEYGRPVRQEWDPNGDILGQLADRAYYAGVLPYHDGKWGFQDDAWVDNLNSFYGGTLMSAPGSVTGSAVENFAENEKRADDLAKLGQMGITGTYNVPRVPRNMVVAPEEYIEEVARNEQVL